MADVSVVLTLPNWPFFKLCLRKKFCVTIGTNIQLKLKSHIQKRVRERLSEPVCQESTFLWIDSVCVSVCVFQERWGSLQTSTLGILIMQCVIQQTWGQASSDCRQDCELRWVTEKIVSHYKELLVWLAAPPPPPSSLPLVLSIQVLVDGGILTELCLWSYWTSGIISSGLYNPTCWQWVNEFKEFVTNKAQCVKYTVCVWQNKLCNSLKSKT